MQRNIAVFTAFAVAHQQQMPLAVDVAGFKAYPFGNTQAAGIDDGERHPVDRAFDPLQNGSDFFLRQYYRQSLRTLWSDNVENVELLFQGGFKKELDAAQIHGDRTGGQFAFADQVDEELTDFLIGQ